MDELTSEIVTYDDGSTAEVFSDGSQIVTDTSGGVSAYDESGALVSGESQIDAVPVTSVPDLASDPGKLFKVGDMIYKYVKTQSGGKTVYRAQPLKRGASKSNTGLILLAAGAAFLLLS